MLLADVIAIWLCMADVLAIVADVKATVFFICGKPQFDECLVVADVITTLLIG